MSAEPGQSDTLTGVSDTPTGKLRLPASTVVTTRTRWVFAEQDRPLLTESVRHAPKLPLRQFLAYHLDVQRLADGTVVKVSAAGTVPPDHRAFTSETWRSDWPLELAPYLDFGSAS